MEWCGVKLRRPPSEPRQETTKSPVRKHSHSRVHLNKWVCVITFGIFSGKPLIAMCFPQIHTACLRDHIPATLKRLGLVLRPDSGCALLINNTERGGVEFCTEACRRVTRAILKLSISHESWDVCPHAWERSVLYRDPTAWILDQNDVFFPPYYKVLNGREVGHDGDWRQRRLWQTQIQMSVGFSPEISVVFFFFFLSAPLNWLIKGVWW